MGITYQDLPSCLVLTHKYTAVEPLESAVILVPNGFEGLICELPVYTAVDMQTLEVIHGHFGTTATGIWNFIQFD